MTRSPILNLAVVCSLAAAFVFAGCSGDTTSGETTGSLSLNLEVGNVDIDKVEYLITGDGTSEGGSIDTSAPGSTASLEWFGLLPGKYTVTLSATATDGETMCEGSEDFPVVAGTSIDVIVYLRCKLPETLGGVRVNGEFNVCAVVDESVVKPLQTSVGNDIDLEAQGEDAEGDDITYLWTGTGGDIDDPSAKATTYTCLEEGVHAVTIRVWDEGYEDECMDHWTTVVTCVAGEVECTGDLGCDDENDCTQNVCAEGRCLNPDEDPGASCDQDGGAVCDGDGNCVECNNNLDCDEGFVCDESNACVPDLECIGDDDCGPLELCIENACIAVECKIDDDCGTEELCIVDECRSVGFCDTGICAESPAAKDLCVDSFITCLLDNPDEAECIALSILLCNDCNEDSDCDPGEVCNDNNVCEPTGEIALPMVVDDHYFGRSGFSNGPGGDPLHTEDNDCPERAGEENGLCHRFIWDGMDGAFTGTFWTDGEGFVDLNGLPVEGGATEVSFYAWGATGGEVITFGAGIVDAELDGAEARRLITLTTAPTLYTVSLAALAGYTDVYGPFIWAADTTGNPSGFEFYVDDIQWIQGGGGGPGCSDAIDFEDGCGPYVFSDFGGGVATVIDNPDSSGINTTARVAQMQKFAGEVFGGSTLALDSAVDWSKGTAFTMKVWASREVPVLFKLEGLNQERPATQTGSSSWEELCYDFTGTTGGAPANAITFIFDLGVNGDAGGNPDDWTFFFDGIVQTDSCGGGGGGGELTVNGDFETGALNIDEDPANGWTLAICGLANSCKATMDEANGGVWSGNLVRQGGIGDAVIKNANIGIGTVTPNSPVTVSVDVKGTTADGGVVFIEFFSELSGGGVSKAEFVGGGGLQATDTWTKYTLETTTGPDVSGGVTLQLKSTCGAATTCVADVFFDNASVTVP